MAPGNSTDVQLAAGGNATVGSVEARMGWAPFNHHRDGKALLGQLDLAFLGAYACELRQLLPAVCHLVAGGDAADAGSGRPSRLAGWAWHAQHQQLEAAVIRTAAPRRPAAVGMFVSGHLGDRVDLRYFLTGACCGRLLGCVGAGELGCGGPDRQGLPAVSSTLLHLPAPPLPRPCPGPGLQAA